MCDFDNLTAVLAEGEEILGLVEEIHPLASRLKIEVVASAQNEQVRLGEALPLAEDVIEIRDHVNSVLHTLESRVQAYLRRVPRTMPTFVTDSNFQATIRAISAAFADVSEWQATMCLAMGSERASEVYARRADGIRRHLQARPVGCVKAKKRKESPEGHFPFRSWRYSRFE